MIRIQSVTYVHIPGTQGKYAPSITEHWVNPAFVASLSWHECRHTGVHADECVIQGKLTLVLGAMHTTYSTLEDPEFLSGEIARSRTA